MNPLQRRRMQRTVSNYSNQALRKRVIDAVVQGRGRGGKRVQKVVAPYAKSPYPTGNIGAKPKVPAEARPRGWGLYSGVREALGVKSIPGQFIEDALNKRSEKEYEKEWSTTIKKKQVAAQKIVAKETTQERMAKWEKGIQRNIGNANERNSRIVSSELIQRIKTQGTATIVDLGSGAGKTILPIITKLSRQQRQRVKVAIMDVSVKDLETTRQGLIEVGVPAKNIIVVPVNFGEMANNSLVSSLAGKADMVTSGAALHHISRSQIVFSEANKLLKKGGSFKFWDWSRPAWRSGTLLVAPKGAKVSVNGLAYSLNGKIVKAERGTAFISRSRGEYKNQRSELRQTREMLSTWISLLNFSREERKKYEQEFDQLVAAGKPIKFAEYLQKLESIKPSSKAKPQVMEAHKTFTNYLRALKGVGFQTKTPLFSPDSGLLVHYSAVKK